MAYKITVNKACVNRAAAVAEIHTQLLAMGWTYIDGIVDNPALSIPYTDVSIANDTFTKVGHTLVNGTPVTVETTGTIPGGFSLSTLYYVVSVSGDTFKLSATYGGTAVNISSQGVGNHSVVERFRVYSSDGEDGSQITSYVQVFVGVNYIAVRTAYKYDLSTRTLMGIAYFYSPVTTSEAGFYLWIHGDKNFVHIGTKVVSTYFRCFFGFMKPFYGLYTTLSQAATASTNTVVLNVASSAGFEVGYVYQIIGISGEGRDDVTVTAIGTGTITISSLARNYGIDARIGISPCLIGHNNTSNFGYANPHDAVGLNNISAGYGAIVYALALGGLDPNQRVQKYILQPFFADNIYNDLSNDSGLEGYMDENILISPSVGMVIEDTFAVGKLDSGTSSGSNSTSVLNDTSKAWVTNAYAGKVIVIFFGLGSGMIKKILSNTSTSLTLDTDVNEFETIPDTTSQYYICDEGYRYFTSGTGVGTQPFFALREGI